MFNKIKKVIKTPKIIPLKLFGKIMSDDMYLEIMYEYIMGKKLDFNNVKTFNEKLQWLKINDRNPMYTKLVDKYEVRKYIEDKLGNQYLIPIIGVYDKFEDIDFSILPQKFVIKCTHDSGGVIVCRDINKLNLSEVEKKIKKLLTTNFYYWGREWPYKNVKPRIIIEEFLESSDNKLPIDYKFSCFNGKVDNVMLCLGRGEGNTKFYFFNKQWKLLRYNITGKNAPEDFTLPKPKMMDKMFEIAEILSENLPYVRVDLYCENDQIYFGELTFYPDCGFDANLLKETDELFGDMIDLNQIKRTK